MGLGAQVREGCLLEEEANGAHCVGLKQTILFPFVTLGSLINFCDCLMAGGTSRKDHSEVGSSYIHFNYTPDGDKTTASLFGDVPRGVMLEPAADLPGRPGRRGRAGAGGLRHGGRGGLGPARGRARRRQAGVRRSAPGLRSGATVPTPTRTWPGWCATTWSTWPTWSRSRSGTGRCEQPFFARQEMGDLVYAGGAGDARAGQGGAGQAAGGHGRQGARRRRSGGRGVPRAGRRGLRRCSVGELRPGRTERSSWRRFEAGHRGGDGRLHRDHPGPYAGTYRRWEYSGSSRSSTGSAGRRTRFCRRWTCSKAER